MAATLMRLNFFPALVYSLISLQSTDYAFLHLLDTHLHRHIHFLYRPMYTHRPRHGSMLIHVKQPGIYKLFLRL